jgi:hypothetical protein
MIIQVLVAAGLPLGRLVWRGQHVVLPPALRWGSVAAVAILGLAAWMVLAGANLVAPGAEPLIVRVLVWFFAAYFLLNTLGNLLSTSRAERYVMTPITILLTICFGIVALMPPAA